MFLRHRIIIVRHIYQFKLAWLSIHQWPLCELGQFKLRNARYQAIIIICTYERFEILKHEIKSRIAQ